MQTELLTNAMLLKPTADNVSDVLLELENCKSIWLPHHIILNLSDASLESSDFVIFVKLIKEHSKRKKSFVLLAPQADFNTVDENISVVPTQQEALDIIEMEEIERDLGF